MEGADQCRVFEYGCMPPVAGGQELIDVLYKRNNLWNALVKIEHKFREESKKIITPTDNVELEALDAEIDQLRAEIKSKRKKARKSVEVGELRTKLNELRERRSIIYPIVKEARKALVAENKENLKALETERKESVKEAYHNSGLWWGNYNDVINNSYNIARVSAMKSGVDLKFHRFNGSGKVSMQIQGGLSVEDLFAGKDSKIQIEPIDYSIWDCPIRAERRKKTRTTVKFRVATTEDGEPVYAELPMIMHRPLPVDGIIKMASIAREHLGNSARYKLILTVTYPQHVKPVLDKGCVGIDFGWRSVEGGLRVAYWVDEKGNHGELVLPPAILDRFKKVDDLKSVRSKHFNSAIEVLSAWKKERDTLPEWLIDKLKFITKWHSPGKFKQLMKVWNENRFSGDQEIVAYLEEYLDREKHLWLWEVNLRDKIQRRRRELYRIFTSKLVKKYSTIILEKFDLRMVTKKPKAENGTSETTAVDHNRTIASVSILRNIIDSTFFREGKYIIAVESLNTTIQCHKCGHVEKFDKKQIFHTCSQCGELWDQDYNAAVNILQAGLEDMSANTKQTENC